MLQCRSLNDIADTVFCSTKMTNNQRTENYRDHIIAPSAKPNPALTMPNSQKPDHHPLDTIYKDVSTAFSAVSDYIHDNPKISHETMQGLNRQMVAVIMSVNAIAEANQKLEYAMTHLERGLNKSTTSNSSGRVFRSYEELAANNAE